MNNLSIYNESGAGHLSCELTINGKRSASLRCVMFKTILLFLAALSHFRHKCPIKKQTNNRPNSMAEKKNPT